MKSLLLKKHSSFIAAAMLFFLITSACQPSPEYTQKAWIDSPFAGSSFFPGSSIHLVAHAFAEKGIAEVQSFIDGVPYSRGAPNNPGEKFALYTQDMIINDPGEHTIELVAFDAQGAQSSPISVQVKILAFTQPAPTDAVPPTLITPTYTPYTPFTPSPTLIFPTYTPYIPTQPVNTPIPPVQISFWADQTNLQSGECTSIHWSVQNANSIFFNGNSVGSNGAQNVCPSVSTTYTLDVNSASGNTQRSVTITVTSPPPADTQPPEITSISHTPDKIWDFASCGPDTLNISVTITDSSGVSNAKVHFRVVKGGTTGSWVKVSMSGSGSHYQAAVGPNNLMNSLSNYGGVVQYYITAVDSKGNTAQSGQSSVEIRACMI